MAKLDEEIDRLFQLPLTEFTAARNALAKDAGTDGAGIKALAKPPVAAWAVNQLYWKNREVYDGLVDTAVQMRKAHKSVMEGKNADLRVAGKMHEEAVEGALRSTVALMKEGGQPVTDTTRHAILNTLRALPGEEPPGRLTQTLAPGGFEMLAGITIQGPPGGARRQGPPGVPRGSATGPSRVQGPSKVQGPAKSGKEEREAARAREQKLALERAVREADQKARHAEFEAARAAREAGKAEKKLEDAQAAFEAAREALKDAERDAKAAVQGKESADRRVRDARSALDAARAKLESA